MAVVAMLVAVISGNAMASGVTFDFARWNVVPLTDEEMEGISGEGWQAVARAVVSAAGGLILGWELERAGVRDAYMELRDAMEGAADLLAEYEQYNPRANLKTTCPRCDAIRAARE